MTAHTCTVTRMLGVNDEFSESRLLVGLHFINFNVFRLEAGGQCKITNGSDLYCVKITMHDPAF
jgi:hypothetical protein